MIWHKSKVEDEPIPLQCLARAHDFVRGGSLGGVMSNNILKQVGTKSGRIFFAINSGYFIAGGEKDDALRMTKSRIQIYDDGKSTLPKEKSKTIEAARLYFGGMHIVLVVVVVVFVVVRYYYFHFRHL